MSDTQVVPARAAVLAASLLARNQDSASNTLVSATASHHTGAVLVLLPPGVSAPALGLNALIPGTAGWQEAGLGEKQSVDFHAPVWTYELLFWAGRPRATGTTPEVPGPIDIPVWAIPDTGAVHAVDVDTMVAELEPQVELGKAIFKDEDGVLAGVRTVVKVPKMAKGFLKIFKNEVADLVNDIKGLGDTGQPPGHPRPTEAGHPAIESVDYRTWVSVKAGLERDRVHATHLDQYLGHRGVPSGRWPAIDAAWQGRADADPLLAAWADFDLNRMRMTGAVWG